MLLFVLITLQMKVFLLMIVDKGAPSTLIYTMSIDMCVVFEPMQ